MLQIFSDEPYKTRPGWEETGSILKSKTPCEELASFMNERAGYLEQAGEKELELDSRMWSCDLSPNNLFYRYRLVQLHKRLNNLWWRKDTTYFS
jgi:hypothetical protein